MSSARIWRARVSSTSTSRHDERWLTTARFWHGKGKEWTLRCRGYNLPTLEKRRGEYWEGPRITHLLPDGRQPGHYSVAAISTSEPACLKNGNCANMPRP